MLQQSLKYVSVISNLRIVLNKQAGSRESQFNLSECCSNILSLFFCSYVHIYAPNV